MKRLAGWVMALMLLVSAAGLGPSTALAKGKAKAKSSVHQATGTISSVNANQLVLSHKVKGKEEQTTFVMNDQTKREGNLSSGEKATVHYTVQNNEKIATMVKPAPMKTAKK